LGRATGRLLGRATGRVLGRATGRSLGRGTGRSLGRATGSCSAVLPTARWAVPPAFGVAATDCPFAALAGPLETVSGPAKLAGGCPSGAARVDRREVPRYAGRFGESSPKPQDVVVASWSRPQHVAFRGCGRTRGEPVSSRGQGGHRVWTAASRMVGRSAVGVDSQNRTSGRLFADRSRSSC
jgi:hypothetical protein